MSLEKIDKFSGKLCSMSVAGLDPSGGAGILADLKSFHAHGIYATCVTTTLTSQNPFNVSMVQKVDVSYIEDAIDRIMDVYPVEYMKTGVLYSEDIIKAVAGKIREYNLKAVVDPVMISESGCTLAGDCFASCLNKYLLKDAYLTTPNVYEAEEIIGHKIDTQDDMIDAALKLNKKCNCIITGGHMHGNDVVCHDGEISLIEGKIIKSDNTHGTGCNYSATLTSRLIQGYDIVDACKLSNEYIQDAIRNGFYNTPYQFSNKF